MTTDNLVPDLIGNEGYRQKPYKDSRGYWTGGVGHLLSTGPTYPPIYDNYSHGQWMAVLSTDIIHAEEALDTDLGWWRHLSDIRQDVMVELAFNLGEGKLRTWKHTLSDIEAGRFVAAEVDLEHDQPWASQVGHRAVRLALQMETNVHQPV
jgi:lysozyme